MPNTTRRSDERSSKPNLAQCLALVMFIVSISVLTAISERWDTTSSDSEHIATDASCFETDSGTITYYLDWEDHCDSEVVIPNEIDGNSVTDIHEGAFAYKELTSIVIPDTITIIGRAAFMNNNLTSLTIPNSVMTIRDQAFEFNDLTSLTIPDSVTTIGSYAFRDNQLTSVSIPDSVSTIGDYAFWDNSLDEVGLPAHTAYSDNNSSFDSETVVMRRYPV